MIIYFYSLLFWLFGLSYFSLNKIVFNFDNKIICIKNYNPLVNLFRKLFKIPPEIKFDEIENFYSDVHFGGPKAMPKYFTVLQTNAPFKFRIAIFQRENQSLIFTNYLNGLIKHHSTYAEKMSDATVMP